MTKTGWRYIVARELQYIDLGRYLLTLPYQLLLVGGMLKVIFPSLSYWHLAAMAPALLAVCSVAGRLHNHKGWLKYGQVVQAVEQMSWPTQVNYHWWDRLARKMGFELDNIPKDRLPPEIERVLRQGPLG